MFANYNLQTGSDVGKSLIRRHLPASGAYRSWMLHSYYYPMTSLIYYAIVKEHKLKSVSVAQLVSASDC